MTPDDLRFLLQRPIAFHRVFASVAGSAAGGLFLSQLFYWSDKGSDPDGWIYKTLEEWHAETALTRSEQERARRALIELGILAVERRGLPARLYFRLDSMALTVVCASPDASATSSCVQPRIARNWRTLAPNPLTAGIPLPSCRTTPTGSPWHQEY